MDGLGRLARRVRTDDARTARRDADRARRASPCARSSSSGPGSTSTPSGVRGPRRACPTSCAPRIYPDALPCLDALRERGYLVGVAGNTSADTEAFLRAHCGKALIASSAGLGAAKPSQEFFAAIARLAGLAPAEIAYVGDRVDNDILPALRAGMMAVHIRRGPWGRLHAGEPDAARATLRIDSLAELPGALAATSA